MSLLLKALKQAEAANAGKPEADRIGAGNRIEGSLELEPLSATGADSGPEWVEPPGLVFGNAGPASIPRPAPAFRLPQLSLVPVVALLAGVIAVGYGIYLYVALQPPDTALPAPPPPPVAEVAPPEIAPSVASAVPALSPDLSAPSPAVPAPSPAVPAPSPAVPAPSAGAPGPASPTAAETSARLLRPVATAASPATPAPAPTSVSAAPPAASAPAFPPARQAAPGRGLPTRATLDTPQPAAPIQFQPDVQSALLSQAHAAYQRGALVEAQRLYTQAAARNRGVDALLGLAAIASVQNREIDAQRLYREVLDMNPRNATAQAALLDLLGNTDGPATESRLKTLIDSDPGPQLYQTLGNLYADQKRWSDAQAAYFEAYRYAPDNADYAFNLAVSLDQLRQGAAALRYYEKALATDGAHRFDRAQAAARVQQLKAVR